MEKTEITMTKVTGSIVVTKTYTFEEFLYETIDFAEYLLERFKEEPEYFGVGEDVEETVEIKIDEPELIDFIEKDNPKSE